jgi:hypothetical protein
MRSQNQDEMYKGTLINCGRSLPPSGTRWKTGQSGNPKGRPKKEESIVDLLTDLAGELCPTDPEGRSFAELLVRALVHQGLRGNLGAIKEIFNRLAGRVPFVVERIGALDQLNRKTSSDCGALPQSSRTKLTLGQKNEILGVLGLDPIGEGANQKENAAGVK